MSYALNTKRPGYDVTVRFYVSEHLVRQIVRCNSKLKGPDRYVSKPTAIKELREVVLEAEGCKISITDAKDMIEDVMRRAGYK